MLDEFLSIALIFQTFCFFGWIWECIYESILNKKIINRGFLAGPYIPIYGFGGIFLFFSLNKFQSNFLNINSIKIFLIGLISATLLEYFTSFILEKIFKARWWDYSNYKFNVNGRICLIASLFWGLITVIVTQFINPNLYKFYTSLNHDIKLIIVTSITTAMIIDIFVTIDSIINLKKKIDTILEIENQKLFNRLEKIEGKTNEYKNFIKNLYKLTNPDTIRLLKAFPKLKFNLKEKQSILNKLKQNINKKKDSKN